jgi:hypothetical protein
MDGNGRWAEQRGLPRVAGHRAGAEALRATLQAAAEHGVEVLTVYAFSSENWTRPETGDPCDPPVITTDSSGALYVEMNGTWAAVDTGGSIAWYEDRTALVAPGDDAYPALDLLFG